MNYEANGLPDIYDFSKKLERTPTPKTIEWLNNLIAVFSGWYPSDAIKSVNPSAKVIWFHENMVQDPCPDFLTSIEAAVSLVERTFPDSIWTTSNYWDGKPTGMAQIQQIGTTHYHLALGFPPAQALCIAALRRLVTEHFNEVAA